MHSSAHVMLKWCSQNLDEKFAGIFQTQVEVASAASDGDLDVAVEIIMSQQVCVLFIRNLLCTCIDPDCILSHLICPGINSIYLLFRRWRAFQALQER